MFDVVGARIDGTEAGEMVAAGKIKLSIGMGRQLLQHTSPAYRIQHHTFDVHVLEISLSFQIRDLKTMRGVDLCGDNFFCRKGLNRPGF